MASTTAQSATEQFCRVTFYSQPKSFISDDATTLIEDMEADIMQVEMTLVGLGFLNNTMIVKNTQEDTSCQLI